MNKHEVLTLLERFPDLVDSDDLIQDLYTEASSEPADEGSGEIGGEQRPAATAHSKHASPAATDNSAPLRPR